MQFDVYEKQDQIKKIESVTSEGIFLNEIENPFFSIVIPTYKRSKTISEAIESAINQTIQKNYEIVVVSNGKEEGLDELIRKYADNKISYYENEENIGLCGNWTRCIELAKGEYVVMLHDDDIISPFFLEVMYKTIVDNKNPGIVGVNNIPFSDELPLFNKPQKVITSKITPQTIFLNKTVSIAGMTFKKNLGLELGGFADEFYPNEDSVFIFQASLRDNVVNIENELVGYRQEMNVSLENGVLDEAIYLIDLTRKSIAQKNVFAKMWMYVWGYYFLLEYIDEGEKYWKINLDKQKIIERCGYKYRGDSYIKRKIMDVFILILIKLEQRKL